MSNNFITNNSEHSTLKKRLEKLISASQELKFLVGFSISQDGRRFIKVYKKTNLLS